MNNILIAAMIGSFITLVVGTAVYFIAVPYFRLQAKRRQSWDHIPQPGEIWIQDDTMIYIEAVGPVGVELMAIDGNTKAISKWRDSWDEWQLRLHTNTIFFSGTRQQMVIPE